MSNGVSSGKSHENGSGGKYLGVTPPISLMPPTERDLHASRLLLDELKARDQYEGPEDSRKREVVLGRLNTLVKKFVYRASLQRGFTEAKAREAGGKIFAFGSYRLGVHGPGADIDTLLVVPRHIERDDFFSLFQDMVREFDGVEHVTPVPEAYVPIIKTVISGIDLDVLFAKLAIPSIPDTLDLRDDSLLKNLDERDVRSIGGSRVTDEILRLVPDVAVFREALRTVKLWAKQRAIYGNVMGFCGGVAWAMLVARICQLYPNGCVGSIISRFFIIMYQWQWPQPVLLKAIEDGPLQLRVWNPKLYPADRAHRMPIITPSYPSMCSTHNVTLSTQSIMTSEFKRASEIVDKIFVGGATWSELFAPHDFFSRYRYYLQITASSSDGDKHLKWSGTVESKIRQLVMKLEYVDTLALAHPFVKGFTHEHTCVNEEENRAVRIGEIPPAVAVRTSQDVDGVEGAETVWTTSFYIGLVIERKQGVNGQRKLDISYPTIEFTKTVKMWEGFDDESMGVIVRYIKSAALPDYVKPSATAPAKILKRPITDEKKAAVDANGAPTGGAGEDDDQPLKKLRSSSFVPEDMSAPSNGGTQNPSSQSPMPNPSPLAAATNLAAAEQATNAPQGEQVGASAQFAIDASGAATQAAAAPPPPVEDEEEEEEIPGLGGGGGA